VIDILILSGKQGSGKSTTAETVKRQAKLLGYDKVISIKFADPLYELHDTILDQMEEMSGLPRVKKDGVLLQLLGTDWGRTVFGENIWVEIVQRKIDILWQGYANSDSPKVKKTLVIVDDCRFENEFNAFPYALRVRLNAAEEVRKTRTNAWRENTMHPSEVSLDIYDIEGKFDLYLQTDIAESSPEHCATLITAQLLKKTWIEKRGRP